MNRKWTFLTVAAVQLVVICAMYINGNLDGVEYPLIAFFIALGFGTDGKDEF